MILRHFWRDSLDMVVKVVTVVLRMLLWNIAFIVRMAEYRIRKLLDLIFAVEVITDALKAIEPVLCIGIFLPLTIYVPPVALSAHQSQ